MSSDLRSISSSLPSLHSLPQSPTNDTSSSSSREKDICERHLHPAMSSEGVSPQRTFQAQPPSFSSSSKVDQACQNSLPLRSFFRAIEQNKADQVQELAANLASRTEKADITLKELQQIRSRILLYLQFIAERKPYNIPINVLRIFLEPLEKVLEKELTLKSQLSQSSSSSSSTGIDQTEDRLCMERINRLTAAAEKQNVEDVHHIMEEDKDEQSSMGPVFLLRALKTVVFQENPSKLLTRFFLIAYLNKMHPSQTLTTPPLLPLKGKQLFSQRPFLDLTNEENAAPPFLRKRPASSSISEPVQKRPRTHAEDLPTADIKPFRVKHEPSGPSQPILQEENRLPFLPKREIPTIPLSSYTAVPHPSSSFQERHPELFSAIRNDDRTYVESFLSRFPPALLRSGLLDAMLISGTIDKANQVVSLLLTQQGRCIGEKIQEQAASLALENLHLQTAKVIFEKGNLGPFYLHQILERILHKETLSTDDEAVIEILLQHPRLPIFSRPVILLNFDKITNRSLLKTAAGEFMNPKICNDIVRKAVLKEDIEVLQWVLHKPTVQMQPRNRGQVLTIAMSHPRPEVRHVLLALLLHTLERIPPRALQAAILYLAEQNDKKALQLLQIACYQRKLPPDVWQEAKRLTSCSECKEVIKKIIRLERLAQQS